MSAGVSAAIIRARKHIYTQFEQHNAFNESNAVTMEQLNFNYSRYSFTKRMVDRYLAANVIVEVNNKYYFCEDNLQSLNVKQMYIVLISCGVIMLVTLIYAVLN